MTDTVLTRRERQLMDLLYVNQGISVGEVNEILGDGSSYASTRAALSRLVEKNQLRFTKAGSRYIYRPVADSHSAGRTAVQRVVDTFFAGSTVDTIGAVLGFSDESLSEADYIKLMQMLETARQGDRQ